MKKIGLLAIDSTYPNLALMKISSHYKYLGNIVEWYNPLEHYDKVYAAKVFTFTPNYGYFIHADDVEYGGTGIDIHKKLPGYIDRCTPDYSLYPAIDRRTAYGFLTRGCPNRCKWCVVPQKEGGIRPYMDVEEIAVDGRDRLVLMDNNVLACDYGLQQIVKIVAKGYHVDFNQGLDARLVTEEVARLLARVKWIKRIRFGCDTYQQIAECDRAMDLIHQYGYKGEFFLYCMLNDNFQESYYRVSFWRKYKNVIPHAQPYRSLADRKQVIPQWQKDLARWTDRKEFYISCRFEDFEPRKGFKCKEYFYDTRKLV